MAKRKPKPHSVRPAKLRKGNAWQCNCGEFNDYTNSVCWSTKEISITEIKEIQSKGEKSKGRPKKELTDEQKEHFKSVKPQSERLTSPGLGDIEDFFSFLD